MSMDASELLLLLRDNTEFVTRGLVGAGLRPISLYADPEASGGIKLLRVQIAGDVAACEVLGPPTEIRMRGGSRYPFEAVWQEGAVEVFAVLTQAERLDVERWIRDRYESAPAVVAAEAR